MAAQAVCLYVSDEHKLFQQNIFLMLSYCNNLKAISFVVTKTKRTSYKFLTSDSVSLFLLKLLEDVFSEILQEWEWGESVARSDL